MTDCNNWPALIHLGKVRNADDAPVNAGREAEYPMLPLNEYQMGNILGLLKRSKDKNTGDWYLELLDLIVEACHRLDIPELTSNWGDTFRLADICLGERPVAWESRDGEWVVTKRRVLYEGHKWLEDDQDG